MDETMVVKVETEAMSVPDQARAFVIASGDDMVLADTRLVMWKELESQIHEAFDPIVEAAYKAHREATSQRKKYLDPIEEGRKILKPKMSAYIAEQERLRQEATRKAEEEARKQAEEDALNAAVTAEAMGAPDMAQAIIDQPVQYVAPVLPKATPKTTTTFRTVYSAEVVDIKKLCKAVAEGRFPTDMILPNMTMLNKMASAMKESLNIDGVVVRKKVV